MLEFLFNKVGGLQFATLLKKSLHYRCFPLNFAKFLRTPVSKNSSNGIFCIFVLWIMILLLSQSENQNILQRCIYRNSRSEVLCKKGVLENFSKLTGKHLRQSLFLTKVAVLRLFLIKKRLFFNFIQKETLGRCFPVRFSAKIAAKNLFKIFATNL